MTTDSFRRTRLPRSDEFKLGLVALCQRPGISVSQAALQHGVNANLLRRWIKQFNSSPMLPERLVATVPSALVPICVDRPVSPKANNAISLDIQYGGIKINVRCPAASVEACARLLGGWLK